MTQQLPPKKEVALALLERSNVDVYLDPRAAGVVVPPQFRKEPRLILKVGLNMPVPIPDLRVDDESMSCTLSFNRTPFYCVVPWSAVFAMVGDDGRGMVWPDDVPQELAARAAGRDGASAPAQTGPTLVAVPPPSSGRGGSRKKGSAASRAVVKGEGQEAGPRAVPDASRKRTRKKKETPRPVLVSVPGEGQAPAPPPSPPAAVAPPSVRRPPPVEPSAPPPSQRPKRELPPYLRVVK